MAQGFLSHNMSGSGLFPVIEYKKGGRGIKDHGFSFDILTRGSYETSGWRCVTQRWPRSLEPREK